MQDQPSLVVEALLFLFGLWIWLESVPHEREAFAARYRHYTRIPAPMFWGVVACSALLVGLSLAGSL